MPKVKIETTKVEATVSKYYQLLSRSHAFERTSQANEQLANKLCKKRFRTIDKLSNLPAQEIGDVARKIEAWAAETSLIDGVLESQRYEDKLILSALRDLIEMQS